MNRNITRTSPVHFLIGTAVAVAIFMLAGQNVDAQTHYYYARVATTDMNKAATDADVTVTIYGDRDELSQKLRDLSGDDFQDGDVDDYLLSTEKPVGKIYALRLEHDDSGKGSGWHVNYVHITDIGTDSSVDPNKITQKKFPNNKLFKINRWLAKDEADGKLYVVKGNKPEVTLETNPKDYKPVLIGIVDVTLVTKDAPFTWKSTIEKSESLELSRATEDSKTTDKGVTVTASAGGAFKGIDVSLEVSTHYAQQISKTVSEAASKSKGKTATVEKERAFTAKEKEVAAVIEEKYKMKADGGVLKLGSQTINFSVGGDAYTKARVLEKFNLPQDQKRLDAFKKKYKNYGL